MTNQSGQQDGGGGGGGTWTATVLLKGAHFPLVTRTFSPKHVQSPVIFVCTGWGVVEKVRTTGAPIAGQ